MFHINGYNTQMKYTNHNALLLEPGHELCIAGVFCKTHGHDINTYLLCHTLSQSLTALRTDPDCLEVLVLDRCLAGRALAAHHLAAGSAVMTPHQQTEGRLATM